MAVVLALTIVNQVTPCKALNLSEPQLFLSIRHEQQYFLVYRVFVGTTCHRKDKVLSRDPGIY